MGGWAVPHASVRQGQAEYSKLGACVHLAHPRSIVSRACPDDHSGSTDAAAVRRAWWGRMRAGGNASGTWAGPRARESEVEFGQAGRVHRGDWEISEGDPGNAEASAFSLDGSRRLMILPSTAGEAERPP